VDRLVAAGAVVEPADLAVDFPQVRAMHRRIMAVEAAAYHRDRFPRFREAFGRNIASLLEEGLAVAAVDYAEALAHQRSFSRTIGARIAPFDALVMPATNTTAPPTRATTGDPKFQSPWSYAGVPAVSLPCGLAGDGFPAALQLVARHGEDARLLRVAQWCEQALAFDDLPPLA
jgi:Asp-tRNA(Asn)/Glu-tRNA(Gln) amidotransferase A subunit family amidase